MASDAETLQIVLEAVSNMDAAVKAASAGLDDVAKAVKDLDGQTARPEIDVSSLVDAVASVREVAEAIRDVDRSGGGAPAKGFFDGIMAALSPTKLLSDALGVFGGNILTNVVSGIASVLNPLNLLSGAFDLVTGAVGTISDIITGGFTMAFEAASTVVSGIGSALSGIVTVAGGVLDFFGGLASGAMSLVSSLTSIVDTAVAVGSALVGMAQSAVAALSELTQTSSQFNDNIFMTGKAAGATAAQMEALSAAALEVGNTTSVGATEASSALQGLQKAGLGAQGSLDALGGVVSYVEATGIDMGSAVGQVSQTLKQFGLDASESQRLANLFAAGASEGFGEVAGSMSGLGAVAGTFNLNLEEVYSALGLLSKQGFDTSQSAVGLRLGLLNLINPSETVSKALEGVGLSAADLNPQTKSLADILDTLGKKSLDDAAYLEIFGNKAGPAMQALVSQGSTALSDMTAKMTGTSTAADLAASRAVLLTEQMSNLGTRTETTAILLGTALEPAFLAIVNGAIDAVSATNTFIMESKPFEAASAALAEAAEKVGAAIASTAEYIPGIITAFASFVTQAAETASALSGLVGGFEGSGAAAGRVSTAIGALASGFLSVASGVASFVSSLLPAADGMTSLAVWGAKAAEEFGAFMGAALDLGGSLAGAVLPAVLDLGVTLANLARNAFDSGASIVAAVADWVKGSGAASALSSALSTLSGIIGTVVDAFLNATAGTARYADGLRSIANVIAGVILSVVEMASSLATTAQEWLNTSDAFDTISAAAQFTMEIFDSLVEIVFGIGDATIATVEAFGKFAAGMLSSGDAGGSLVGVLFTITEGAESVVAAVLEAIAGYVEWVSNTENLTNAFDLVVAGIDGFISTVSGVASAAVGFISGIGEMVAAVLEFTEATDEGFSIDLAGILKKAFDLAVAAVATAGPALLDAIAGIFNSRTGSAVASGIDSFVAYVSTTLVSAIKGLGGSPALSGAFGEVWGFLSTVSDATSAALGSFVVSVFDALVELFTANATTYGAKIGEAIAGIASSVGEAAKSITEALAAGMGGGEGENPIVSFFSAMVETAGPAIEAAFGALADLVQAALGAVLDGLGSIVGIDGLGSKIIDPMIEAIKAGDWGLLAGQVTDLLVTAIGDGLVAVGEGILGGINALFGTDFQGSIVSAMGVALTAAGALIASAPAIIAAVGSVLTFIGGAFAAVFTAPAIAAALAAIGIGLLIADALGVDFSTAFSDFGSLVSGAISTAFDAVVSILKMSLEALLLPFTVAVEGIKGAGALMGAAAASIGSALGTVSVTIEETAGAIKTAFVGVWDAISAEISALVEGLTTFATDSAVKLGEIVTAFLNFPADLIAAGAELAGTVSVWLEQNVLAPIVSFGESVINAVAALGPTIADGVSSLFSFILDIPAQAAGWGASIIDSFIGGITSTLSAGKQMISDAASSVFSIFESNSPPKEGPLKDIDKWGTSLGSVYTTSFASGLTAGTAGISAGAAALGAAVTETSKTALIPAAAAFTRGGTEIASAFMAATNSGILAGKGGLTSSIADAFGPITANSPPKEGPLANIDAWGSSIGGSFTASVGKGIGAGASGITAALAPVALTLSAAAVNGATTWGASFQSAFAGTSSGLSAFMGATTASLFPESTKASRVAGEETGGAYITRAAEAIKAGAPKAGADIAGAVGKAFGEAAKAAPVAASLDVGTDSETLTRAVAAGNALARAYGDGLTDDPEVITSAAAEMLAGVSDLLNAPGGQDLAAIKKSGENVIGAFIDGISSGLGKSDAAFRKQLEDFIKPLVAHSPPTVGPLKEIDAWGDSIGSSFSGALAAGIGAGARELLPEVARVGATLSGALGDTPVGVAANVAAGDIGMQGGAPQSVAVNVSTGAVTINTGEDREKFFGEMVSRINDGLRRSGVTGRGRAGQAVRGPV